MPEEQQRQQRQEQQQQQQQQTVVVAVDFTDESERAVKYYIDRFHRTGNRVLLLHCTDLPRKMMEEKTEEGDDTRDAFTELWEEEESNLKSLESKLMFLFMSHEIPATLYTVIGKPSSMIWRVADKEDATLIVLGSRRDHGKKSPFRSVIGSMAGLNDGVTDSVLKNASCPVVVCRSPQDERRFSLFQVADRRFSLMPTPRQRCQSTSDVEVMQKNSKKQRHSSGGESIASRIKRRFSSGGHRLMSVPSAMPGSEVSGKLEEHLEDGEGDDSAFAAPADTERPAGESSGKPGDENSNSESQKSAEVSARPGSKKNSVTFEVKAEVSKGGRTLEEVDENDESKVQESKECGIRMKSLNTSAATVAATAKA